MNSLEVKASKSDFCQEIRIYGPPGTGKTTTLSGLVATACRDYGSEAVLVASFTRTAAKELVSRQLPLNDEQVGTLHALCYRALDRPKILTGSLLKDWNDQYPTRAFGGYGSDLDDPYSESSGVKEGDLLLQDLNRLRGLGAVEDSWPLRVQSFAQDWNDFKAQTGTIDFTDLIEQCVRHHLPIPHEAQAFFLDEVQDFSPLELTLARQWGRRCRVMYLVGDEDQCLYSFKGCRPDAFLHPPLPAEQIRVLGQSHRVPRAVHAAAVTWIEQVTERMPKEYKPRPYDGVVDTVSLNYKYPVAIQSQLEDWLAAGKTVAFLASCSFFLDPLKHQLRDWGYPFHNPYRTKRGDWNPLGSKAGTISSGERLLAFRLASLNQSERDKLPLPYKGGNGWWTYAELWKWAATVEGAFARGAKTAMRRKAEDELTAHLPVAVEDLDAWIPSEEHAEAVLNGDVSWFRARLLKTYDKAMTYACNVLEKQGAPALTKTPQILLGTIHSVKGGEADIVVLFPDLSPSGYREWTTPGEPQDSVRRCFYVGQTRAREELYWAQPVGMSISGYL